MESHRKGKLDAGLALTQQSIFTLNQRETTSQASVTRTSHYFPLSHPRRLCTELQQVFP